MSKNCQPRTPNNLLKSFAGESQARNRYTFFSSAARSEGYMQIAAIFEETANQEKEHAERFFKLLRGGEDEISAIFPAGVIRSTSANLKAAADGEYEEWHDLYPRFAAIAREEGFIDAASAWEHIIISEKQHEKRYRELLDNLDNHRVFRRDEMVMWRCRNCGYLHFGFEAPQSCPACLHSRGYFELLAENW